LENLDDDWDRNRAWENMILYIKISVKESPGQYEHKQKKTWFHDGCSKFIGQRKQATWLNYYG
jgi:hypothetical protein